MKFDNQDLTLILITLFGSLSIVDIVTTSFVLQRGGRELNLFLAPFASDPAFFIAVKAVGFFFILGIAIFNRCVMERGDHVVLATACGMGVFPALWNLHILFYGL